MIRRTLAALSSAALLLLLAATTAIAGGWADIKVDAGATTKPDAGKTLELGFTVLQHGVTPAGWVHPTVTITNVATGEHHDVAPTASGADGHFVATVTFPSAGYWTWSVSMPELLVDSVPVTMEVRTASGTVPAFDPAVAMTAIEQAKRDLRREMDSSLGPQFNDLETSISGLRAQTATLENKVQALTQARDELTARLAAAQPGSDGIPVLGIVLLAVLAGATAGFAMAWLGGRSAPTTISPTRSPGADPA
jgi:hypothetical protein